MLKFPTSDGRVPSKWLSRRLRIVSLVSWPTSVGMVPFRFPVDAAKNKNQENQDEPNRDTVVYRPKVLTNLEKFQVVQSSNFHWDRKANAVP